MIARQDLSHFFLCVIHHSSPRLGRVWRWLYLHCRQPRLTTHSIFLTTHMTVSGNNPALSRHPSPAAALPLAAAQFAVRLRYLSPARKYSSCRVQPSPLARRLGGLDLPLRITLFLLPAPLPARP